MGGAQRHPSIADDGIALAKLMGFAEGSTHPTGLYLISGKDVLPIGERQLPCYTESTTA